MIKTAHSWLFPPQEDWEEFFKIEERTFEDGFYGNTSLYFVVDKQGQVVVFPDWGKTFSSHHSAVQAIKDSPTLMPDKLMDKLLSGKLI